MGSEYKLSLIVRIQNAFNKYFLPPNVQ
ncbi:hypothetical protein RHIZ404_220220 [Rhizobium sp. EC-SD404]|nr:hypothetical protein RHIZ404_220220 [Rhizobium sp. EC-SD404]